MNNVIYYSWFDTAVNGWLIDRCAADIRQLPAIGVVAETSCRFLRQTTFPQHLTVGLGLERRGNSSVVYRLAVYRVQDGQLDDDPCAVGRFVHVYVDRDKRRPVPIPEPLVRVLDELTDPRPRGVDRGSTR